MRVDRLETWAGIALCLLGVASSPGAIAQSGFFVTRDGYFVTNHHLAVSDPITIRDGDGRTYRARIVAEDPINDLALLKAEGNFSAIPIARSDTVNGGDRVFAPNLRSAGDQTAGSPLVEGTISGVMGSDVAPNAFRVTVPVGPRESGAPVLTPDGRVIGVITTLPEAESSPAGSAASQETGGYAIRSNYVIALIESEELAWAKLLSPGDRKSRTSDQMADDIERAIGEVIAGNADIPAPAQAAPITRNAVGESGKSAAVDNGQVLVAEMVEIGLHALSEKDYRSAFGWLSDAAERGNPKAQVAVAEMYEFGRGVALNDAAAIRWYRRAAEQGDAEGQARLGLMYADGKGVARNDDEALNLFRQAAERGNASGQNFLGMMYRDGRGVYADEATAVNWFRQAALQGDPSAQNNLGIMFREGRGIEEDQPEAAYWFRKAADQNYADAEINLGLMYREHRGVHPDDSEAVKRFRQAAEQGNALAQYYLGLSYAEGRGIARNDAEAANWLKKSAAQGLSLAQDQLHAVGQ